jgi:hypothetical protein
VTPKMACSSGLRKEATRSVAFGEASVFNSPGGYRGHPCAS